MFKIDSDVDQCELTLSIVKKDEDKEITGDEADLVQIKDGKFVLT